MLLRRSYSAARLSCAVPLAAAVVIACGGSSSATPPGDGATVGEQGGDGGAASDAAGGALDGAAGDAAVDQGTAAADAQACGPTTLGQGFSTTLDPYPRMPTATTKSVDQMYGDTTVPGSVVSAGDEAVRRAVLAMYRDFGIDVSIDSGVNYSSTLQSLRPKHWSSATPDPLAGDYTRPFSVDAPFYHPIPCDTSRTELPTKYFDSAQINALGFDDLAYGVAVSGAADPVRSVTAGGATFSLHVRSDALSLFGHHGDADLTLIDATNNTLYSNYAFAQAQDGVNWTAGRIVGPQTLPNLGDQDGTIAAGFADMALLLRPGQATDAAKPIGHALAIGGNRLWKARVYPAQSGDAWIYGSSCLAGFRCDGLVPYGGVVQLDPTLDLSALSLSLPARRILEAVQTYGAYLMNTTGTSFNVYTSIHSSELDAYGGVYQPNGGGVQNEIQRVLATAKVYVVLPVVKR